MVFFLNWMHDHLTEKELQAAVDRREKQEQEMEGPLEIVIDLADLGYGDNEDYAEHVPDDGGDWDSDDVEESEFYEPPVDYEDEDAIALDMEEAIDADRVIVMDDGKVIMDGIPKEIFSRVKELKEHGLDVPQATELAFELKEAGMPLTEGILSRQELVEQLTALLSDEK